MTESDKKSKIHQIWIFLQMHCQFSLIQFTSWNMQGPDVNLHSVINLCGWRPTEIIFSPAESSFDSQAAWVIYVLGLFFDMQSTGVFTTRHWQTFGWLVQHLTLILLVADLAYMKLCENPEKWPKPWQMGTHLRVLGEIFQMNTNMTGFGWFSNVFAFLFHGWM